MTICPKWWRFVTKVIIVGHELWDRPKWLFFLLEAIIGGHGMIFDQSDGNLWPKWSPCLSDTLYISITSVDKCQSFLRLIWILSADCNAGRSCRLGRSHVWRRLPRCCRRAQARTLILMQWHGFEMWWFSNNLSWNEKTELGHLHMSKQFLDALGTREFFALANF